MQAARRFEFEQNGQKHRGSQMAVAKEFVNRHRCRTQRGGYPMAGVGELPVIRDRRRHEAPAEGFRRPAGSYHEVERGRDVACGLDQNGAVPDEPIAAVAARIEGRARHGEYLAALLERTASGDQRARPQRRFDDDDTE